jgi:hypothetical protein
MHKATHSLLTSQCCDISNAVVVVYCDPELKSCLSVEVCMVLLSIPQRTQYHSSQLSSLTAAALLLVSHMVR